MRQGLITLDREWIAHFLFSLTRMTKLLTYSTTSLDVLTHTSFTSNGYARFLPIRHRHHVYHRRCIDQIGNFTLKVLSQGFCNGWKYFRNKENKTYSSVLNFVWCRRNRNNKNEKPSTNKVRWQQKYKLRIKNSHHFLTQLVVTYLAPIEKSINIRDSIGRWRKKIRWHFCHKKNFEVVESLFFVAAED